MDVNTELKARMALAKIERRIKEIAKVYPGLVRDFIKSLKDKIFLNHLEFRNDSSHVHCRSRSTINADSNWPTKEN